MPMLSRSANAALAALIVLQLTMLVFLLAGLEPHPPRAIVLFAMGPFLGTALAIAVAALIMGPTQTVLGRALAVLAALCALLSYGPQKWLEPAIGEIWPAVLGGQMAAIGLLACVLIAALRGGNHESSRASSSAQEVRGS